ncbi:uncharacterized protein LOC114130098 isoform X2 [Aphis gossypii]|uniref:uncharacterized protein LOC114130098 isoform X2 n=1 Tax=Aphis gossypii TaxID=80765 RepID=UPI0021599996|nr:uncharacterized protein LOC114130098 isoform X2 [Aphis gossypii]
MRRPRSVFGSDVQTVMISGELRGRVQRNSIAPPSPFDSVSAERDQSTRRLRHNGVGRKDSRSTYTSDKGLVKTNHVKLRSVHCNYYGRFSYNITAKLPIKIEESILDKHPDSSLKQSTKAYLVECQNKQKVVQDDQ